MSESWKDTAQRIEDLGAEIDGLREENAELWKAAKDVYDCWGSESPLWNNLRIILAKTAKPDYAPARDPSDHQACGGLIG